MKYQNSYACLDPRLFNRQPPTPLDNPKAGHFNLQVAERLGWCDDDTLTTRWVDILGGHYVPEAFEPLAMAYAGHQFGQWAGQLGDGRGLLMAQVIDKQGKLNDLHLKGSGLTPYSRMGDGRAVVRSTIREYLCGHALNQLGIASSNALGFVVSDTPVRRERMEQGAALMRVADCHVRLGHVEWIASFAPDLLAEFTDYMLDTYYPECRNETNPIAAFLTAVVTRTAKMIADWQLIGFAHGVMNTDNLSITGRTLDFGPFGFMERFDPAWINNHSDHTGRYSYQNQPAIGHWNLNIWLPHFMRLPTLDRDTLAECLAPYESAFMTHYQQGLCRKLGLPYSRDSLAIAFDWLSLLEDHKLDYTNSFRALSELISSMLDNNATNNANSEADTDDGSNATDIDNRQKYDNRLEQTNRHDQQLLATLESELSGAAVANWQDWKKRYLAHFHANDDNLTNSLKTALEIMQKENPVYILRNSMAQRAIDQGELGDFTEVDRLYQLLTQPYSVQTIALPSDTTAPEPGAPMLPISCSS